MLDNYQLSQPIAYKIMTNAIRNNRFSHAYLIEAKNFNDISNLALSFAKAILCPKGKTNNEHCENCNQCKQIDNLDYMEIKIINPDGMWIKKEQLDELQKEFSKKAIVGNKKIYIINQAHKMNPSAANSILKFLEEPEENIIAILTTDNIYQLLNTIVSRCQIIRLTDSLVKTNDALLNLANILLESKEDIDEFVNDEKNSLKMNKVVEFAVNIKQKGIDTLLYTNKLWHDTFKEKDDIIKALRTLLLFYKDVLNYKLNQPIDVFIGYEKEFTKFDDLPKKDIIEYIKIVDKLLEKTKVNINNNLLIDKLIIEMNGGV